PPLKLYEGGKPNETLFSIIEKAVRTPEEVLGDLHTCVSAINLGERESQKPMQRLGCERYLALTKRLLEYTEKLTRQRIRELPDREWSFTDYIDNDGVTDETITVCATVRKEADRIYVDFAGSSAQCSGSIFGLLHMNANYVFMA